MKTRLPAWLRREVDLLLDVARDKGRQEVIRDPNKFGLTRMTLPPPERPE